MLPDERDDMKIEIVRKHHGDIRDVLSDACAEFAQRVAADPALACDPSWPSVRLVLSGDGEASAWGCRDAVGYFAVIASEGMDDDGRIWLDVNERLEVHVNLDVAARELAEGVPDAAALESWFATVPHELLHVRDWMAETGGKTPLDVFDEGDGELSVRAVLKAVDRRHAGEGNDTEDAVERMALAIAARHCDWPRLEELAAGLAAAFRRDGPRR